MDTRLLDHADIGFTSTDTPYPRGEVVVCSPSLTLGYWNNAGKERESYINVCEHSCCSTRCTTCNAGKPDHDYACSCPEVLSPPLPPGRWYRTGDLASIDHTGKMALFDRVGAVVSTKGGAVILPSKMEAAIEGCATVANALVCAGPASGDVFVLVMHVRGLGGLDGLQGLRGKSGCSSLPMGAGEAIMDGDGNVCMSTEKGTCVVVPADVAASLPGGQAVEEAGGRVVFINLCWRDEWTEENGLMTGSLKKRRGVLIKHYAPLFNGAAGVEIVKTDHGDGGKGSKLGGGVSASTGRFQSSTSVPLVLAVGLGGLLAVGAFILMWRRTRKE